MRTLCGREREVEGLVEGMPAGWRSANQHRRELEALVDLRHLVGGEVVFESAKVQLQHRRQRLKEHALFGILLAKLIRVVLVLAIQELFLDILIERRV